MKELTKVIRQYLKWADRNGVKRMYEVLPKWVLSEHPNIYEKIREFKNLEQLLHKNDLRYRALDKEEKAAIKKRRTALYESIAVKAAVPRTCKHCRKKFSFEVGKGVPVSLRTAVEPRRFCSVACATRSKETRNKKAATNLEKYGSICSLNGKNQIKAKKQTWMRNYGTENPSQAPEVVSSILRKRYGRKEFVTNAGKVLLYQGYEHFALKAIESMPNILTYTTKASEVGMFYYRWGNSEHRYLPDVKVTLTNKNVWYIEVKSTLTLAGTASIRARVLAKAKTMWCTHRLNYCIVVYNRKGKLLGVAKELQSLKRLMKAHKKN